MLCLAILSTRSPTRDGGKLRQSHTVSPWGNLMPLSVPPSSPAPLNERGGAITLPIKSEKAQIRVRERPL